MGNNEPQHGPGAILLSGDPTGQVDGRIEYICDLSQGDYQRFRDTYKALYDIFFANTFAYFRGSARAFYSIWTAANEAFAAREIQPNTNPGGMVIWMTQLMT